MIYPTITLTKRHKNTKTAHDVSPILWLYVLTIFALFIMRDAFSIPIPQYALVAVVSIFAMSLSYRNLVVFVAFMFPLLYGMNSVVCTFLAFFLIVKCPRIYPSQYLFPLILGLFEIANFMLWKNDERVNDLIVYLGVLTLFFFLLFDRTQGINYRAAIKLFCISVVFTLILIYYNTSVLYDSVDPAEHRMGYLFNKSHDASQRLFSMDPNTVGYVCVCVFASLLLGSRRLRLNPVLLAIMMVAVLYLGATSVSRTWVITTALITILYGFFCLKKWKLVLVVIAAVAFGGGTLVYLDEVIDPIEKRFKEKNTAGGNGRVELFQEYSRFMSRNPEAIPLGIGAIGYKSVAKCSNSLHNAPQQIYVCTGVVGLLFFLAAIILFYNLFVRRRKIPFVYFLPTIAAAVFLQTIQFLNPHLLMLPCVIAAMELKYGAEQTQLKRIKRITK